MIRKAFEAVQAMVEANADISASNQFVRGQNTKRGDEITMGCSEGILMKVGSGKYIACLLVINAEQFETYKNGTEAKHDAE